LNPLVQLTEALAQYSKDPLTFVLFAFPWDQPGPLDGMKGPEKWQVSVLKDIRNGLKDVNTVIHEAVASGHGIGKSALVSWLILWAVSTHEDTRGVVTANTMDQLTKKTWAELSKWYSMFIGQALFKYTATSIYSVDEGHERTWRIDAIPWSKENPEAFAGLHNQGKRILVLFDEASAIDNKIWEVAEGAMTDKDTEIIWCAFGNPTRNTGRFYDCFHKLRNYWHCMQVDSRSVSFSNKDQIKMWANEWGEDSDFFKVRVRGIFPSTSSDQLISMELVDMARGRQIREDQFSFAPVIIGVDNSWTGDDAASVWLRQGNYSRRLLKVPKNDNDITMGNMIMRLEDEYHADAVNIDMGYGTGLKSFSNTIGRNWNLIPFGGQAPKSGYKNMRAYMADQMREWLRDGGCLPDDQTICDDLTQAYRIKPTESGVLELVSKAHLKEEGIPSPNDGDALMLTFALPIVKKGTMAAPKRANTEYNLF
jgi:hypothetical protein